MTLHEELTRATQGLKYVAEGHDGKQGYVVDVRDLEAILTRHPAPVPALDREAVWREAEKRFFGPRMVIGTCEDRESAAFVDGAQFAADAIMALAPAEVEALPVVNHKGPHDTDASMFLQAAQRLDEGFPLGGSNLTNAVVRLIRREVKRAEAQP